MKFIKSRTIRLVLATLCTASALTLNAAADTSRISYVHLKPNPEDKFPMAGPRSFEKKNFELKGDQIRLSQKFVKAGKNALEWNYKPGDTLIFTMPVINAYRTDGTNLNYWPAFSPWIFSEKGLKTSKLLLSTYYQGKKTGNRTQAYNNKGFWWVKGICYAHFQRNEYGNKIIDSKELQEKYKKMFNTKTDQAYPLDQISITIPADEPAGTLYIDYVSVDLRVPYRRHSAAYHDRYHTYKMTDKFRVDPEEVKVRLKEMGADKKPTAEDLAWLEKMRKDYGWKNPHPREITEELIAKLEAKYEEAKVDPRPTATWGYLYEWKKTERLAFRNKHYLVNKTMEMVMNDASTYYLYAKSEKQKQRLVDLYLKAFEFYQYQGNAGVVNLETLNRIKPEMEKRGLYDKLFRETFYGIECQDNEISTKRHGRNGVGITESLFSKKTGFPSSIEHLGWGAGQIPTLIRRALLLKTDAEQVAMLKYLRKRQSEAILRDYGYSGFWYDGTVAHHGLFNWAYGAYCTRGASGNYRQWVKNEFLTPEALEVIRRGLLTSAYYSNGAQVPMSIRGRRVDQDIHFSDAIINNVAVAGSIDLKNPIDEEAARIARAVIPEKRLPKEIRELDLPPLKMNRSFCMPTSGFYAHRWNNHITTIKGYNREIRPVEHTLGGNTFARNISLGFTEIYRLGKSQQENGSGTKGLDWNHLPGTTAAVLDIKDKDQRGLLGSEPERLAAFAGGLSHLGNYGIFAMDLDDRNKSGVIAKKSWMLFGDRIVCLGSGIRSEKKEFPIHTTLFQKQLNNPKDVTVSNKGEIKTFPTNQQLASSSTSWVKDPQGLVYFPTQGDKLHLLRQHQVSYDGSSAKWIEEDGNRSEADVVQLRLEHGNTPDNANYEYAILTDADDAAIKAFAKKRPYKILQQTSKIHLVRDNEAKVIVHVIFDGDAEFAKESQVSASSAPAIIATSYPKPKHMTLSYTSGTLKRHEGLYPEKTENFTIKGNWKLTKKLPGVVLKQQGKETNIQITAPENGATHILELTKP